MLTASLFCNLFFFFFLYGIAISSNQDIATYPKSTILVIAITILVVLFIFLRKSKRGLVPIILIPLIGTLIGRLYLVSWRENNYRTLLFETEQTFSGIIIDPPDIRQNAILYNVLSDQKIANDLKSTVQNVIIQIRTDRYPVFNYGDHIKINGKISKPESFNGFDYPLYLERSKIYGQIFTPKKIQLLEHDRGSPFLSQLYKLRSNFERISQINLTEPEASFLNGILLGSKRAIPARVQAELQQTGTSHIIAISGANITILLDLLVFCLPIYNNRQRFNLILVVAIFVTILTGASASVIRGAVVAVLSAFIRLKSRRAWSGPLLICSSCLILLGNPLLLVADPGFQLSFAAFAGLAYFGSPIQLYFDRARLTKNLPKAVSMALAETCAATLGTAGISFTLFGRLSLLGFIVNPLVLWLLPAITFLGIFSLLISQICSLSIINLSLWFLLRTSLKIIESFGQLNFGLINYKTNWTLPLLSFACFVLIYNRHLIQKIWISN